MNYKLKKYEESTAKEIMLIYHDFENACKYFARLKRYADYNNFDKFFPSVIWSDILYTSPNKQNIISYILDTEKACKGDILATLIKQAIIKAFGMNYNQMIEYYYLSHGLPLEMVNRRER